MLHSHTHRSTGKLPVLLRARARQTSACFLPTELEVAVKPHGCGPRAVLVQAMSFQPQAASWYGHWPFLTSMYNETEMPPRLPFVQIEVHSVCTPCLLVSYDPDLT